MASMKEEQPADLTATGEPPVKDDAVTDSAPPAPAAGVGGGAVLQQPLSSPGVSAGISHPQAGVPPQVSMGQMPGAPNMPPMQPASRPVPPSGAAPILLLSMQDVSCAVCISRIPVSGHEIS